MNRGVAILAVCALFLSGVAIGALGMHLYYAQRLMRPGEPPALAGRFLVGHLTRQLDLSQEQQAEIRVILDESRQAGAELRQRMRPEVEDLLLQTREAIEEVLTPEPRERFDEMHRFDRRPLERLFLGPERGRPGRGGPGRGDPGAGAGPRGRRPPRE